MIKGKAEVNDAYNNFYIYLNKLITNTIEEEHSSHQIDNVEDKLKLADDYELFNLFQNAKNNYLQIIHINEPKVI